VERGKKKKKKKINFFKNFLFWGIKKKKKGKKKKVMVWGLGGGGVMCTHMLRVKMTCFGSIIYSSFLSSPTPHLRTT